MKNRIFIISFLFLTGMAELTSCSKEQLESPPLGSQSPINAAVLSPDKPAIYNYVWLTNDQMEYPQDSVFHMSALAVFTDGVTGQISRMSGLSVNERSLVADAGYVYSFAYNDEANNATQEGKDLYGTNVKIKIAGSSPADTITQTIYMPKRIFKTQADFPDDNIDISKPLTLNWVTDPDCTWGNMQIQIQYHAATSRFLNDASLPPNDTTVTYIVPDNGSYTISSKDLRRLKPNSIVTISVGRGSAVEAILPISRKRIFYFATSSLSSVALTLFKSAN